MDIQDAIINGNLKEVQEIVTTSEYNLISLIQSIIATIYLGALKMGVAGNS